MRKEPRLFKRNRAFECLFFVLFIVGGANLVSASPIGYDFLEHDNLTYLWVWNQGEIELNYFYDNECMDQVSNNLSSQWEYVDKWVGLKTGNTWHMDRWNNENPCSRYDETDNLTYSNNSVTTKIYNGPLSLDLGMKSHIKTNDSHISQIYTFKATHTINQDVWFMLYEQDIKIAGDQANDYVIMLKRVNETFWNGTGFQTEEGNEKVYYDLNNIRENNQTIWLNGSDWVDAFFIDDWVQKKHIQNDFRWNDYEWKLKIDGNVSLYVNLGTFSNREEKTFTKRWVDARCACLGGELDPTVAYCYGWCSNGQSGCHDFISDWFTMNGRVWFVSGECNDCYVYYETNQTGSWTTIPVSSGEQLRCNSSDSICRIEDEGQGTISQDIFCDEYGGENSYVQIMYQASVCSGLGDPYQIMSPQPSICLEPDIVLISPENGSSLPPANITFSYNFTEGQDNLLNCTLFINEEENETSTDVATGIVKDIGTILDIGEYNWSVNCTGIEDTLFPWQFTGIMNHSEPFDVGYLTSTIKAVNVKNQSWLDMNGTTNYLATEKSSGLITNTATTNYSISMWVYHDGYWTGSWSTQQSLFSTRAGSSSSPFWYLTLRSSQYQMRICDSSTCDAVTEPQIPGQWNHIVAVFGDSPDGNLTMYLNGEWAGTNDNTGGWEDNNQEDFWIGGATGFMSFNGSIDEVRIYNRSLSETEAVALNNSGRRPNTTLIQEGLIVHLPFSEASGVNTYDIRDRFANMTINGGENISWSNDGLYNLTGDDWEIDYETNSIFNLTNRDFDSSWVNISYTRGLWEEWSSYETWTLTVADIQEAMENYQLAIIIGMLSSGLLLLFLTSKLEDNHWPIKILLIGVAFFIFIDTVHIANLMDNSIDLGGTYAGLLYGAMILVPVGLLTLLGEFRKVYKFRRTKEE